MRAVIVDDNEIDRLNLGALLGDHPEIKIAGEAALLESAVALIEREKPDVVFLDIHLGRQKGFKALEKISYKPQVVITTSHPHYALKGFEIEAVDYLLKPVMEDTLARAVNRLLSRGRQAVPEAPARLDSADVQLFKQPDGVDVIQVSQILAITGERIYSRVIVMEGQEYLHNRSLREWKEILPEKQFKALDRSTIVNIREVRNVCEGSLASGYLVSFRKSSRTLTIGDVAMKALRELI